MRQSPRDPWLKIDDGRSANYGTCDLCHGPRTSYYTCYVNDKPINFDVCSNCDGGKLSWGALAQKLIDAGHYNPHLPSAPYVTVVSGTATDTPKPSSSPMQLSSIAKRLFDGDVKKLVKAGYIDSNLNLTDAGRRELEGLYFEDYKARLVLAAEVAIAEAAEEKKC